MRRCWSFMLLAPSLLRRGWLLSVVLVLSSCMLGSIVSQAQPATFRFIRPRARRALVPFEMQRNLIVVSVKLNGKGPYNFLLDTGVNISLITEP
ncbi:MAG TPA: hypothetical protein VF598_09845, partial [Hymenobacter sp.]